MMGGMAPAAAFAVQTTGIEHDEQSAQSVTGNASAMPGLEGVTFGQAFPVSSQGMENFPVPVLGALPSHVTQERMPEHLSGESAAASLVIDGTENGMMHSGLQEPREWDAKMSDHVGGGQIDSPVMQALVREKPVIGNSLFLSGTESYLAARTTGTDIPKFKNTRAGAKSELHYWQGKMNMPSGRGVEGFPALKAATGILGTHDARESGPDVRGKSLPVTVGILGTHDARESGPLLKKPEIPAEFLDDQKLIIPEDVLHVVNVLSPAAKEVLLSVKGKEDAMPALVEYGKKLGMTKEEIPVTFHTLHACQILSGVTEPLHECTTAILGVGSYTLPLRKIEGEWLCYPMPNPREQEPRKLKDLLEELWKGLHGDRDDADISMDVTVRPLFPPNEDQKLIIPEDFLHVMNVLSPDAKEVLLSAKGKEDVMSARKECAKKLGMTKPEIPVIFNTLHACQTLLGMAEPLHECTTAILGVGSYTLPLRKIEGEWLCYPMPNPAHSDEQEPRKLNNVLEQLWKGSHGDRHYGLGVTLEVTVMPLFPAKPE